MAGRVLKLFLALETPVHQTSGEIGCDGENCIHG